MNNDANTDGSGGYSNHSECADTHAMLAQAQKRGEHLDQLTSRYASLILALTGLGFALWRWKPELVNTGWMTVTLVIWGSALLLVLLSPLARAHLVPGCVSSTTCCEVKLEFDVVRYCIGNTLRWNRTGKWRCAALLLGFVASLSTMTLAFSDSAGITAWLLVCSAIVLYAGAWLATLMRSISAVGGGDAIAQERYLRSGVVVDLDGYRPRDTCACPCGCTKRPPQADGDADTSHIGNACTTPSDS